MRSASLPVRGTGIHWMPFCVLISCFVGFVFFEERVHAACASSTRLSRSGPAGIASAKHP
eukprot:5603717-Prymnesium_polylepis.1